MFVILGANGNTGRIAAETLLAARQPVRVVLRDEKQASLWRNNGAEVALGDLEDAASLVSAFAGARGVYLLLPPSMSSDDVFARARRLFGNAAAALTAAQVPHVVLLSSIGADLDGGTGIIGGVRIAEHILGALAGVGRTFLRPTYFVENHASVIGVAKEHGVLPTFLPVAASIPQIATQDIGRAAARALAEPAAVGATRVWNLVGPDAVTEHDVAAALGTILGKAVVAVQAELAQAVPTFTSFGISQHVAEQYRDMYAGFLAGRIVYPAGAEVQRGRVSVGEVLARLV